MERLGIFFSIMLLGAANTALAVDYSVLFGPTGAPSGDVGGYINTVYQFSLFLGGILAFGAVVYGGLKYIFAAGNPSGQSEGKDWIKSALLGLLLLSGAYLILKTINPNIVGLNLPTLSGLQQTTSNQNPTDYLTKVAACLERGTNIFICNTSSMPQSCAPLQGLIDQGGQCDAAFGCVTIPKNCCGAKKGSAGC